MGSGKRETKAIEERSGNFQAGYCAADLARERQTCEKIRFQVPECCETQSNHKPNRISHRQSIHLEGHSEEE